MIELVFQLILLALLFVASAFFSGSETALFSLSRLDLRRLRREHELLDQPRRLIIAILCGNQVVNVAATATLTGVLVALYGVERAAFITTVVMVPLLLLLGEATPKTIAISDPAGVSTRIVAKPMHFWVNLISPLVSAVRFIADRLTTRIVGEETAATNIRQVDEFRSRLDEGVVRGDLTATERALIYNLLQAGTAEVVEIMVPRTGMDWIDGDQPIPAMVEQFMAYRHKRVPVYRGHRDNVIGFLCAEDILQLLLDDTDPTTLSLDELLRPAAMVPGIRKIDEMFDYLQANEQQAVIVVDEFGGVDGLLTMNDVLACIFGRARIDSEGDRIRYDEERGVYELPGSTKLLDLNSLTSLALQDRRMTTVGGMVLRHFDRLPVPGDQVTLNGYLIEVLSMDGPRVDRLRITVSRDAERGV